MKTYKWTEEQKKALRGSILKWQRIVNGTGTDEGPDNCPCCKKWYFVGCNGCPIRTFTGESECISTPYDDVKGEQPTSNQALSELNFLRAVYLAGGGK
jgi:hypothetical protein